MTRRPLLLLLATALAACTGQPTGPAKPGASATRKPATAASTGAVATPAAALAPPVLNAAPATGTRPFDATIVLDAGWIVANNGGAVIANNGGGVVALPGPGGLRPVAGGNPVLADAKAAVFAAGTLLANNGAGLAARSAGVIANNGGGVLANNGSRYRLAQAGARLGEGLPAANVAVGAIDPLTAEPVPVGVDEAGGPVYAVLTDDRGQVRLHLPQALAGNVRLIALAPTDGRPQLEAYVAADADAQAAATVVDEAEGALTAMIRTTLVARFTLGDLTVKIDNDVPAPVTAALEQLRAIMLAAGANDATPRRRHALFSTLVDPLCTGLDLQALTFKSGRPELAGDPPATVLAVIRAINGRVEAAAAAKLAAEPAYFDGKPYAKAASTARRERLGEDLVVRKPADVARELVPELLASYRAGGATAAEVVFHDLGLDPKDAWRLEDAGRELLTAAFLNLITGTAADGRPLLEVVRAIVAAQGPAILAATDPPGLPVLPGPPVPLAYGRVATLAGNQPGHADGLGPAAAFNRPYGLVLDERYGAPRLYVADSANHRIRRIKLQASGPAVVDTLAGDGVSDRVDGPAATARFRLPLGLALDAQGRLYVADEGNGAVRRIAFDAAGEATTVETLATGVVPRGLMVDGAGDVWLAEREPGRVQQIRMNEPGRPLVLRAGGGTEAPIGDALKAALREPTSLVAEPDGSVLIGTIPGQILRLTPAGQLVPVVGSRDRGNSVPGYWVGADFHAVLAFTALPGRPLWAIGTIHRLHLADAAGNAWIVTGGQPGEEFGGPNDGPANAAALSAAAGLAAAKDGTIYFAERELHRIRALYPTTP